MILVTSHFNWHHVMTLTVDLFQDQICCHAVNNNSKNLIVCFVSDINIISRGIKAEHSYFASSVLVAILLQMASYYLAFDLVK